MNKLALTLVGMAFAVLPAAAQDFDSDFSFGSWDDFNKVEISSNDKHVETSIKFAFPMYFGTSVLTDLTYNDTWGILEKVYPDFMDLNARKNFVYGLEMVSMHVRTGAVDLSLGLRWTFMNFTFRDSAYSLRPEMALGSPRASTQHVPYRIASEGPYDGRKSKIFASYLGIPFRVSLNYGKATVYGGVSAELLMDSYTKYKHPKVREPINGLFNDFRASVEAGISLYNFGLFVNYGLTPLFKDQYSNAHTLTVGVTLGI